MLLKRQNWSIKNTARAGKWSESIASNDLISQTMREMHDLQRTRARDKIPGSFYFHWGLQVSGTTALSEFPGAYSHWSSTQLPHRWMALSFSVLSAVFSDVHCMSVDANVWFDINVLMDFCDCRMRKNKKKCLVEVTVVKARQSVDNSDWFWRKVNK